MSIERQLEACRRFAEDRGYTVVAEGVDESVSATRFAPEKRPGWQSLTRQNLDLIVIWKVDRLARRTIDFLRTYEALQPCELASVQDAIDLSSGTGRAFATILAVFGEMEAASISARTTAARDYLLRQGRAAGGQHLWCLHAVDDGAGGKVLRPIPERAAAVQDAARRLTARTATLSGVCAEWTRKGLKPAKSDAWRVASLRTLLTNPTLFGATVHHGELLRDGSGLVRVDPERAVLSMQEWERLQSALMDWGKTPTRRGEPSLCGGGLAICSGCRQPMHPSRPARKYYRYSCTTPHCPKPMGVSMSGLDGFAEDYFLSEHGERRVLILGDTAAATDVAGLREAIGEMTRRLTVASEDELLQVHRQRRELQDRLAAAESAAGKAVPLVDSGQSEAERWAAASVPERNRILLDWYRFRILPVGRGFRFTPDRVEVQYM